MADNHHVTDFKVVFLPEVEIDNSLQDSELRFTAVLEKLYERHRSVRDAGFNGDAYKPGLDAMLSYCEFLGHPERQFRSIHVAGTNGKGSVCSMLAAALAARGLRVGLYTSPHLVDFRERIKIIGWPEAPLPSGELRFAHPSQPRGWAPPVHVATGGYGSPEGVALPAAAMIPAACNADTGGIGGNAPRPLGVQGDDSFEMIPKESVCEFMQKFDREGLTFFEVTTGMAFWWFAQQKVDVAVIETGLGGRLDSTNVIKPELAVITSIGLDHCDLLGSTRAEIAAEKAGIFKPGVPALVWGRDPETQPIFERIAAAVGAPLHFAEDLPLPSEAADLPESIDSAGKALAPGNRSRPWLREREGPNRKVGRDERSEVLPGPVPLRLDLAGPCQDINLRTVLAALNILGVTDYAVLRAIANAARITGFRGRWETLLSDPLTICDIGHNPPAMEANCRKIEQLRAASVAGGHAPLLFVYGAMADKDVDSIKQYLPKDAEYYLVQPETPRALPLPDLALKLKSLNTIAAGSVKQGVCQALGRARELPGSIVFIGGSTFVVSEAITYIESL